MAALWRARRDLDFRYRHDTEDPGWEEDGWEHPWGSVEEGCLSAWRSESESDWGGSDGEEAASASASEASSSDSGSGSDDDDA